MYIKLYILIESNLRFAISLPLQIIIARANCFFNYQNTHYPIGVYPDSFSVSNQ